VTGPGTPRGDQRRSGAPLPPPPYRPDAAPPARPRPGDAGPSGARPPASGSPLPPVPPAARRDAAAPPAPPRRATPPRPAAPRATPPRPGALPVPPVPARSARPTTTAQAVPSRQADAPSPPRRRTGLPPVPPPRVRGFVPGPDDTQLIPLLPPVPDVADGAAEETTTREGAPGGSRGILRAAGTMAVASLVSRVTGLARTTVITAALGVLAVNDAYNTANTLPNIVYELLLGGVLSSVVVPLLVNAQEKDRDGGVAYTQRLMTVAVAGLLVMTGVAVLVAPVLTRLYGIDDDPAQVSLANWLARILLVEIVFYGLGALATAILNSRGVFGPPAWAPVLNNVVVIATGGLFILSTGPGRLDAVTISAYQVWLLGIGTTLGIAVQSVVLLPLLRGAGVPLRLRWGLRGTGLGEAGSLGLWVVGYVAISQLGVVMATRVANEALRHGALGSSALAVASLLFQMPYGIVGVALLTALLPRMSRAASRHDVPGVVADLALGTRLSSVGLLPVTAGLVVLGPALSTVMFAHGQTSPDKAQQIGAALAVGAFGLLPMAVTLLQLRVFYAMRDARTPTLIQVAMVLVRVPLLLLVPHVVGWQHAVAGVMVATSLTYLVGWVVGDVALRRRLGAQRTPGVLSGVLRMAVVSAAAAVVGGLVTTITQSAFGRGVPGSLVTLVVGTVVIGAAVVAGAVVARVPEVGAPLSAVRARLGRR